MAKGKVEVVVSDDPVVDVVEASEVPVEAVEASEAGWVDIFVGDIDTRVQALREKLNVPDASDQYDVHLFSAFKRWEFEVTNYPAFGVVTQELWNKLFDLD